MELCGVFGAHSPMPGVGGRPDGRGGGVRARSTGGTPQPPDSGLRPGGGGLRTAVPRGDPGPNGEAICQ